jgi:hypothetical protein
VDQLLGKEDPPTDDVGVLMGYLGPSEKGETIRRLYLSLDFRSFVEILRDDVLRTAPLDPGNENSPTLVRIKTAAKVELKKLPSVGPEKKLSEGDILKRYLEEIRALHETTGGLVSKFQADACCTGDPTSTFFTVGGQKSIL